MEVLPGKGSGASLVKGTRIPAGATVSHFESGSPLEEVAENYPSASIETIRGLVAYARSRGMREVA